MFITLPPAVNPSGKMQENSVAMVDGKLFIKYGVSYDIMDDR